MYTQTFMFIEIRDRNTAWKGMQPSTIGILLARPGRQGLAQLGHEPEILSGNQGGSRA